MQASETTALCKIIALKRRKKCLACRKKGFPKGTKTKLKSLLKVLTKLMRSTKVALKKPRKKLGLFF